MKTNPVLVIAGLLGAAIDAAVTLVLSFVDLKGNQELAVIGFAAAVTAVVLALVAQSFTVTTEKHALDVLGAAEAGAAAERARPLEFQGVEVGELDLTPKIREVVKRELANTASRARRSGKGT